MNVLVTGGTGTLGRHVVMLLRQAGHRARIFSRRPRGHVDAVQGDLAGIADSWLKATGRKRRLINLPLPMKFSRDFASGKLLAPDHKDGKVTFEQYLAEKFPLAR